MAVPQGQPVLRKPRRDRALATPKAAQFILENSSLYQFGPDAESESASLALHPLILVYPLGAMHKYHSSNHQLSELEATKAKPSS